jgi:hypothetical protein
MWGLSPQPFKPGYKEIASVTPLNEWKAEWFEPFVKGEHITWQQYVILLSVVQALQSKAQKRISISSGHGIGKSATMSWLLLWYLFCFKDAQVPCTAPTSEQMYDVLWKEVSKWCSKMPKEVQAKYDITSNYVRITEAPETWFARAKTARKESPEALAGVHGDYVMMLIDEACYDEETEILTDSGFKFFRDLSTGDKVLSQDSEGRAQFVDIEKYHEYEGTRTMFNYESRGANFSVTGNHKMLYSTRKVEKLRLKEISELDRSGNVYFPRKVLFPTTGQGEMVIPSFETERKKYPELRFGLKDWALLCAWYLSEGCINNNGYVVITQSRLKNKKKCREIEDLLEKMDLDFKVYGNDFHINYRQIAQELKSYGDSFLTKRVPTYIKHSAYADIFLDTFAKGDGYFRKNRRIFYSSSKGMMSDIQEMLYLTGSAGTMKLRKKEKKKWFKDHYIETQHPSYVVYERQPTGIKFSGKNLVERAHVGKVYCVTTRYGNVFVRREGLCMWSGNSGVPEEIFTVAEGALTNENILQIMISNPTRLDGFFFDSHHRDRKNWQNLSFDCLDSPVVDNSYVERIKDKYGEDSDQFRVRVQGKFPKEDQIDAKGWSKLVLEKELDYALSHIPEESYIGTRTLGVDVARGGGCKNVWVLRTKNFAKVVAKSEISDIMDVASQTILLAKEYRVHAFNVFIDDAGVGGGVTDRLHQLRFYAHGIQGASKPDDREMFMNKRAEMYWALKLWIQDGGKVDKYQLIDWRELLDIRYKAGNNGKLKMMSKVDMGKEGIPSPDTADALSLTFGKPPFLEAAEKEWYEREKDDFDKWDLI